VGPLLASGLVSQSLIVFLDEAQTELSQVFCEARSSLFMEGGVSELGLDHKRIDRVRVVPSRADQPNGSDAVHPFGPLALMLFDDVGDVLAAVSCIRELLDGSGDFFQAVDFTRRDLLDVMGR